MIESDNTKTKGITSIDNEKVEIKIPLSNGSFWVKEYNKGDLIHQLIEDFKGENNEDIPEEYMNDWKEKNGSFKNTDEIRTLLPNEVNGSFIFSDREHNIVLGKEIIPDLIGKPFSDPFEIFVFNKRDKSLKIQKYDYNKINEEGLNHYSSSSAYCNGDNNLFISGGEKRGGNIIAKFWKINLENQIIETFQMPPKKKHSMIYIPGGYIFIVGGNDKKTYFFDNQNSQICKSSDLNNNRTEPALILVSDILYCFDNINSKNSDEPFTCEKMDLKEDTPKWVLITPIIDSSIRIPKMNQKFFGVAKTNDNNVQFLGGNMDKNQEKDVYNYKYIIGDNAIELSDIPFQEYNLKEKTFLTFKKDIEYILPDFNRFHPEVLFFQKNKQKLSLLKYEPKTNKSKDNDFPIIEHKFNFNMPYSIPNKSNKEKADINDINININEDMKYSGGYNLGINTGNIGEVNVDIGKPTLEIPNPSDNNPNIFLDYNQGDKKFTNDTNINLNGIGGIQTPNINIETTNGNGINKINGNIDIGGKINIEGPEINPDINLPQTDVKPPTITNDDFNIKVPEIKIEGEFDGPKIELKEDKNQNILLEDIIKSKEDGNLNIDDINLKLKTPQINIEGSNTPEINIDGPKIESNLNNPSLGININNPEFNISGPKIDTSIKPPNIDSPQIELTGPKLDTNLKSPNLDIKGSIPKFDIKKPEIEASLKGPNIDIKDNNPNLNINGPNINIPSGKFDIKGPEISNDLNGKLNINTNMPKIDFNKDFFIEGTIKGTKDNKHLKNDFSLGGIIPGKNEKNINLNMPEAKANINFNLKEPKTKDKDIYMSGIIDPNVKIPGIEINGPKLKIPSADINANQNINIKGNIPGFEGPKIDKKLELDINKPNIELPSGNIKFNGPTIKTDNELSGTIPGMNVNLKAPNIDIKGKNSEFSGIIPGIKVNGPKIDVPKFDVKEPGMNVNINAPNVDIKGGNNELSGIIPGTKSGKVDIKGPKINVNAPNAKINVKEPNINVKGPHYKAYITERDSYLSGILPGINDIKTSNIMLPSGKFDIEGPKINSKLNGNQNINVGKIEGPKVDFNIKGDKINIPDINIKNPDLNGNIKLKGQNPSLNGKTDINLNAPKISIQGPNINNMNDFVLSGLIPSKNDKNAKIIYDKNININGNVNGDINSKLITKNKLNFHGNLNDLGEIKGSRKVKDSNMDNEFNYNLKVNQNKLKISGNNFQAEPINTNILFNQGNNIENDLNFDIKNPSINLQYPNLNTDTNLEMGTKVSKNLEIGGGEIDGGLNLSKNNNETMGININIDGGNKGIDIDTNFNELKISSQEDKNKENKNSLNNGVSIKRNFNTKLPMVGIKDKNFVSSKISEAGRFDGDNINIDITKTANVGINGQKIGDRIEY